MDKKRWLILIGMMLITVLLVAAVFFGCNKKPVEDGPGEEDDPPVMSTVLQPNQALDKVYNGLVAGGNGLKSNPDHSVENVFTVNMRILNYTLTYKANYRQNAADSEIYLSVFDNNVNIDRATVYYNGKDLFYRTAVKSFVVSQFSSTMMFDTFFAMCRRLDTTESFFGDTVGTIFNRNNGGLNLGALLGQSNITYNPAGANREYVEFTDINLVLLSDTLSFYIEKTLGNIGEKFDIITQKFLNFDISAISQMRFEQILAESIGVGIASGSATDTTWKLSGKLRDQSNYIINVDVRHSVDKTEINESARFIKKDCIEATLGKNRFIGNILIPSISDREFDVELKTNINSSNNMLNEASLDISDMEIDSDPTNEAGATKVNFIAAYYKDGQAFVDATGLDNWLDGAIDLKAFRLPKVYFDNIDATKLIKAGYSNLVKMLDTLTVKDAVGNHVDPELYEKIMNNFGNDGKSTVYFIVTEELIKNITGDDASVMARVAKLLNMDEARLASFIGADFFAVSELVISYNLDTGEIFVTFNHRGEMVFKMSLVRTDYEEVTFPSDVRAGSSAYSKLRIPEDIKMTIDVKLNLGNEKKSTDLSRFLGAMIGDPSGKNTVQILQKAETLRAEGEICEKFVKNENGEEVGVVSLWLKLYKEVAGSKVNILDIRTNPSNLDELLVGYYLQLGNYLPSNGGIYYRISKRAVKEAFNILMGENNSIFEENNILTLLSTVLASEGISMVSKTNNGFEFSLVVSGNNDPVYNLIGIKDTTATVRTKIEFTKIEETAVIEDYIYPTIVQPEDRIVKTLYSSGSAWENAVTVYIGVPIVFEPTYTEESIKVSTGRTVYNPQAFLFGQEITYRLTIHDPSGTYVIDKDKLKNTVIIIDPAETRHLPQTLSVSYTNGEQGELECEFADFYESNITLAGYNMAGFDGKFDKCVISKATIGRNSLMQEEFEVYILVHNRQVLPIKGRETGTGELKELYAPDGTPVVGEVTVDPYTYAMRRMREPDYHPMLAAVVEQDMQLRFNGIYGYEEIMDGAETVRNELSYDIIGYNRFSVVDLDLEWEYDLSKITWRGDVGYAYAYFGNRENGAAVKIAIRVMVTVQIVDEVKIGEESGNYTIDSLIYSSYIIPTVSTNERTVKLSFKGSAKERTIGTKPLNMSDEEYDETYLNIRLNWQGAERLTSPEYKNLISVNQVSTNLFGNGNITTATIGSDLGVGEQTVSLQVSVPSRRINSNEGMQVTLAHSCDVSSGEPDFSDIVPLWLTEAHFPASSDYNYQAYEPYRINPYDAEARLPKTVFLMVNKTSASNSEREFKEYPVNWVTTDKTGKELNLIKWESDGGYGLANPVTYQQDMFVYGKVGDRIVGDLGQTNDDFVWVVMSVRNLESEFESVSYEGFEELNEDNKVPIQIDPYLSYSLPEKATVILASGSKLELTDMIWEVLDDSEENIWVPVSINKDEINDKYDANGRYIFSNEGGEYDIRYTIKGSSEVISQTLRLKVQVAKRTLEEARVNLFYGVGGNTARPSLTGLRNINYYVEDSATLLKRLEELRDDNAAALTVGIEYKESSDVYTAHIQWVREEEDYAHSIDRVIDMLKTAQSAGEEMLLHGYIDRGTVREQKLVIQVDFTSNLIIKSISFSRLEKAVIDKDVLTISTPDATGVTEISCPNGRMPSNLTIKLNKPFALTIPSGTGNTFTAPSDYLEYLLGEVRVSFYDGTKAYLQPVIDFGNLNDGDNLNKQLLENGDTATPRLRLAKLSKGSAIDEIFVDVRSVKHVVKSYSETIKLDLFYGIDLENGRKSEERYIQDGLYSLPAQVTVKYGADGDNNSDNWYDVKFNTPTWMIEQGDQKLFGKTETDSIDARLIDCLSDNEYRRPSYSFQYDLPYFARNFMLEIEIPNKNLKGTHYNATGEISQYNIEKGILTISNPYLFYDPEQEFGMDVSLLPNIIRSLTGAEDLSGSYEVTGDNGQISNVHYVEWTFNYKFEPTLFKQGSKVEKTKDGFPDIENQSNRYFAKCELPAYYTETLSGNPKKVSQTIYLYLDIDSLNDVSGIEYGELRVEKYSNRTVVMTVDPYNDNMGYNGLFRLPTDGLTIHFYNNTYYNFDGVKFNLLTASGDVKQSDVKIIEYSYDGPTQDRDCLIPTIINGQTVNLLMFDMSVPGFENVKVYANIMSRVKSDIQVANRRFDKDGKLISDEAQYLPYIYYIDPYNDATFALPNTVNVKFRNQNPNEPEYTELRVNKWRIWDDSANSGAGGFVAVTSERDVPVGNVKKPAFYSRDGGCYYLLNSESYKGGIYKLQGGIAIGDGTSGVTAEQDFVVYVVVLNRTLKTEYYTTYQFDDPLYGVLEDIGGVLTEDMFTDSAKYYESVSFVADEKVINIGDYPYKDWTTPVLPSINWAVYNAQSVVDWKGGFKDKEIIGNVYTSNLHKGMLYGLAKAEMTEKFGKLVEARLFDRCVNNQSRFTLYAINLMNELQEELERDTVKITYDMTVSYFEKGSTDEEKQYGNYLAQGLLNEAMAAMPANTPIEKIIKSLFDKLASDKELTPAKATIYAQWKTIYDNFKAAGSDTDADLSEYQKLKSEKYGKLINSDGIENSDRNRLLRLYNEISVSLDTYRNAAIWDLIYNGSLIAERARMESIIAGGTSVTAKSDALNRYRQENRIDLGNVGEQARAKISAPEYSIENIYSNEGDSEVLDKFLFNIYSTVALLTQVSVETVIDYSDILNPLIEEATRTVLDGYRADRVDMSLEEYIGEYVAIKTAEIVNGINPDSSEIDFKYEEYAAGEYDVEEKQIIWNKLQKYKLDSATKWITQRKYPQSNQSDDNFDYKKFWEDTKVYHLGNQDEISVLLLSDFKEEMEQEGYNKDSMPYYTIKANEMSVMRLLEKKHTEISTDGMTYLVNYINAGNEYVELVKKSATQEMDNIFVEVQKATDAELLEDYLLIGIPSSVVSDIGGVADVFSMAFDNLAEEMWDRLVASFYTEANSDWTTERTKCQEILSNRRANNGGYDKKAAFFDAKSNSNTNNYVRTRALYIYHWTLGEIGGISAYDRLAAEPSIIGLTGEKLNALFEEMTKFGGGKEAISIGNFNSAFTDEEFESFKKCVFFERLAMQNTATSLDSAQIKKLQDLRKAVQQDAYVAAFNRLMDNVPVSVLPQLKAARSSTVHVEAKAFDAYVQSYVDKAEIIWAEIAAEKSLSAERAVFDAAEEVVKKLKNDPQYVSYLNTVKEDLEEKAIELYRKSVSDEENAVIDYHLRLTDSDYGKAYTELIERYDLGLKFVNGLKSSYYSVILQDMQESVAKEVRENATDPDSNRWADVYNKYFNLYMRVTDGSGENTKFINDLVKEDYIESLIQGALKGYFDLVDEVADKAQKDAGRVVCQRYYDSSAAEAEIMDGILINWYESSGDGQRFEKTYNALIEILVNDKLENLFNTSVTVSDVMSKAEFYDELSHLDSDMQTEAVANAALAKAKEKYEEVTDKEALKTVIKADDFEADDVSAVAKLDVLFGRKFDSIEGYIASGIISDTDKTNLQKVLEGITLAAELIVGKYRFDGWDGKIIETVKHVEGIAQYRKEKLDNVNLLTAKQANALLKFASELQKEVEKIDKGLMPEYDVNTGSYADDYSIYYKAAYIDALTATMSKLGYSGAKLLVDERVEVHCEAIRDTERFKEELLNRLLITADRQNLSDVTSIESYLENLRRDGESFINNLIDAKRSEAMSNDEYYYSALQSTMEEKTVYWRFNTGDNLEKDDVEKSRRAIIFDKSSFATTENKVINAPVYIGNMNKLDENRSLETLVQEGKLYRIPNFHYERIATELSYVDFYGDESEAIKAAIKEINQMPVNDAAGKEARKAAIDNFRTRFENLNRLTIDPFVPDIPQKVQAYGTYEDIVTGVKTIYDLGMVDLGTDNIIKENKYNGQSEQQYKIFVKGDELMINVSYLDRRIDKIMFNTGTYGGNQKDGNMFDMYDSIAGTNIISLNPIDPNVLDLTSRTPGYNLPEQMTVTYKTNGDTMDYTDVIWDMDDIKYSLAGQTKSMRLKEYKVTDDKGVTRKVTFNYVKDTVSIVVIDFDGREDAQTEANVTNTPDYSVWNMRLEITDSMPNKLKDDKEEILGVYDAVNNYIDISDKYSINPYSIEFPTSSRIFFGNNEVQGYVADEGTWKVGSGTNAGEGVNRLNAILRGQDVDRHLILTFEYCRYEIRVRVATDNIKLQKLEANDYINGGTIFLIVGGGKATEQLAKNYGYLYYNFGDQLDEGGDYRKMPLSFSDDIDLQINTDYEHVYTNMLGVLGWDKVNYPKLVMGNNISFTIAIINPVMHAQLDKEYNTFVTLDYISMPQDATFHKHTAPNEPKGVKDFAIESGGKLVAFAIDENSIEYDIDAQEVRYRCLFGMDAMGTVKNENEFTRLAADKNGGSWLSFVVSVPLKSYIYTKVEKDVVRFDRTPPREGLWEWTKVSDHDSSYVDGIIWPLGQPMKAGDLPMAFYTSDGERFSLLWNLDGVNVNRATGLKEGYQVYGRYCRQGDTANSVWEEIPLTIFIEKMDISKNILSSIKVGDNLSASKIYDGRFFSLPLDLKAEGMQILREDGSKGMLDNVKVSYSAMNDSGAYGDYSETVLPLDSGSYRIKITLEDYNATLNGELIIDFEITRCWIDADDLLFVNGSFNSLQQVVIEYYYTGEECPLTVSKGLPTYAPENWFRNLAEKQQMLNAQLEDGGSVDKAKVAAYNVFCENLTESTKEYMTRQMAKMGVQMGLSGDRLFAAFWDSLTVDYMVCEVQPKVKYLQGNTELSEPPVNVGTYTAELIIDNKNYILETSVVCRINILMPNVTYDVPVKQLTYNGTIQNPRVSNLHNADGKLPAGMEVVYTYTDRSGKTFTVIENENGVSGSDGYLVNYGDYRCSVEIRNMSGRPKNYPEGYIAEFNLIVEKKELYIDIAEGIGSGYLSSINLENVLSFNGLVKGHKPSDFFIADVETTAGKYSPIGSYPISFNGFRLSADDYIYTNKTESSDKPGYVELALKAMGESGSLYNIQNAEAYKELMAMFENYKIYVTIGGNYEIRGEEGAVIVNNDADFDNVLQEFHNGERTGATVYMMPTYDKDGNITAYKKKTINITGHISIIGLYDGENIATYLTGLTVERGGVELRLLAFRAQDNGTVCIKLTDGAQSVKISECLFDGNNKLNVVGVRADTGYGYKMDIYGTVFNRCQTGVEMLGGDLELGALRDGGIFNGYYNGGQTGDGSGGDSEGSAQSGSNVFNDNYYGVRIISQGSDTRVEGTVFIGHFVGLYSENFSIIVDGNVFENNRTALRLPDMDDDANDIEERNSFINNTVNVNKAEL